MPRWWTAGLYTAAAIMIAAGVGIPIAGELSQRAAQREWAEQVASIEPVIVHPLPRTNKQRLQPRALETKSVVARLLCPRLQRELFIRPDRGRNLMKGPVWCHPRLYRVATGTVLSPHIAIPTSGSLKMCGSEIRFS
jgi:hypothetical protein